MLSVYITFLFLANELHKKLTAARFKVMEVTSRKSNFVRIPFAVMFCSVVIKMLQNSCFFMIGAVYVRGISSREIS